MLRRKMTDYLTAWKSTKKSECLLIKGARQVGKTFIVRQFAKENYQQKNFIELNFLLYPELQTIFDGNLDTDNLTMRMSAHFRGKEFVPGKTLIFLDEIQKCPNARTALKSLAEDGRFDVIASGSLLGLHFGQDAEAEEEISSIPVGYEKQVTMHALDFEEFLWACGVSDDTISYVRGFFERTEKVPEDINRLFNSYVRNYIVVGGMPEAVSVFCESRNYGLVQETQEKILSSYTDDIVRHAPTVEKPKVKKCFDSLPVQLAKENKKFQYSAVEPRASARKFGNSVQWLADSNMACICTNTSLPLFPLNAYRQDDYFKVYMHDVGLLTSMYGFDMKAAVLTGSLKGPAKGGIYENLIADMLIKRGYPLHYYKPDESACEIEFLISQNAEIVPVEVKSKRGETISLNSYIDHFKPPKAYKLIEGNVGQSGVKITIPHYMAMFL